jgi:HK97 gp10 family phage protein
MGEFKFDLEGVMERINSQAEAGVEKTLDDIADMARSLAPVRKDTRRKTKSTTLGGYRTKHTTVVGGKKVTITGSELATAYARTLGRKMTPAERAQFATAKIASSRNPRAVSATELLKKKTKGGFHRKFSLASKKGGGLRDGVESLGVSNDDGVILGTVISKAPYSKYVEFPTRRTAAQPFLLPAFKVARSRLKANIKAAKGG